jgi:hypothetical protein
MILVVIKITVTAIIGMLKAIEVMMIKRCTEITDSCFQSKLSNWYLIGI